MEKVIYEGQTSLRSRMTSLIIGASFSLLGLSSLTVEPDLGIVMILLSGLVFVGGPYLRVRSSAYKVTTDRVSQRVGLIARDSSEAEMGGIRNVQVRQGALDRLLGIGDVGISVAGQAGLEIAFVGVAEPQAVAGLVRNARRNTKMPPPGESAKGEPLLI